MEAHQDIAQEPRGGGLRPLGTRSHPFRRFATIGARHGDDAGYLERTEAELALLREENARLRMERAQRPDAGSMIERLRSLSTTPPVDADVNDEAWHLFTEALVMRDVLMDVCKEIGQTAITLQTRLSELTADLPEQGTSDPGSEAGAAAP